MTRRRLDAELVRRGLVSSREQGRAAIEGGRVSISGVTATKAATQVDDAAAIELVAEPGSDFVSRGAHKLIGALDAFGLDVRDANALDAGASTGGFTQVLLQRGARHVIAVDVGYGQLAWLLRSDDRVTVLERTNVRHLDASRDELPYPPDLVVADLSFISLTAVLPALVTVAAPTANLVLMVKPQFEVGKERVGSGVVTSPDLRREAVARVVTAAEAEKLAIFGVAASPRPGPKGNVEYFLWMGKVGGDAAEPSEHDGAMEREDRVSAGLSAGEIESAIARAVQEGPQ